MSENQTPAPATKRQMSFAVLDDGRIEASFVGDGLDALYLDPSEVPERVQLLAITEGIISRARSAGSKLEGEARTAAALREVIAKAFDALRAGEWKVERASNGATTYSAEVEAALVFRQLRAAAKGETCDDTIAEVAANWEQLSDEQKAGVKALSRYQQAYAQVKARRAAEKAAKLAKKADEEDESGF